MLLTSRKIITSNYPLAGEQCNILRGNARNSNGRLLSQYLPDVSGERTTKSYYQNRLGGWCSEEIPQHFSRKWSLARNEILVKPCKGRKIPEANHTENQTTEPLSLALTLLEQLSELSFTSPTSCETIHIHISICPYGNQAHRSTHSPHMPRRWDGLPGFFRVSALEKEAVRHSLCLRITVRPWINETV